MKKRILSCLLAAALLLSLTGCKLISNIFGKNDQPGVNDVNPDNLDLDDYSDYGDVTAFWEQLYNDWLAAEERGYVWTITIDEVAVVDALGLAKVTYDLDLSCSHVGEDMFGVYRGSMAMNFDADISGVYEMFKLLGGKSKSDTKGWFRNDRFIMEITPYNADKEHAFISTLEQAPDGEGDASYAALAEALIAMMGSQNKDFEKNGSPLGYWFDWDYHMTSGDMSTFFSVSGVFSGVAYSAEGSSDSSGGHISGSAIAHAPFIGQTFTERYSEDFQSPFPYIIRVYETGEVVLELHSSNGGPVVVKFYGTIDKVPVEATTTVH